MRNSGLLQRHVRVRVGKRAVDPDLQVEVRRCRSAGAPHVADDLASGNVLAGADREATIHEVGVLDRHLLTIKVAVERDEISESTGPADIADHTTLRGVNRRSGRSKKVDTLMSAPGAKAVAERVRSGSNRSDPATCPNNGRSGGGVDRSGSASAGAIGGLRLLSGLEILLPRVLFPLTLGLEGACEGFFFCLLLRDFLG